MSENNELIVENRSKEIKINKKGDSIVIDIDNREMMNKIISMILNFKERTTSHIKKPDIDSLNALCNDTEKEMKEIFGDDILVKIFDVEHPSLRLLVEFFFKFFDIVSSLSEAKNEETVKSIESLYGDKYINRLKNKK